MINITLAAFKNHTNVTEKPPENLHILLNVAMLSIVYVFLLMLPTVVINTMTLYAIYKDPLKCFRNPFGIFSTGVLVADLIAAFIVLPFFGAADAHALNAGNSDASDIIYHIALEVLATTVIISFLTLLGLAVSQLIAVKSPMAFERYVTNDSVQVGLVVIWGYAMLFVFVPNFIESERADDILYFWFLFVHVTMVTVASVIVYIATYLFFAIRAARQLDEQENKQVTREFFKGTCILSLVQILLVWPVAISLYVEEFLDPSSEEMMVNVAIARYICEDIFFIKYLLDPIILVWRVPQYNRAMKKVYRRFFRQDRDGESRISYNRANVQKKDDDSLEDVDVEIL